MNTNTPWALSPRTLRILERLVETRFDVVCEHLAEGDDDVNPHACREEAEGLLSEVKAAVRWADVPAGIRDRLHHTARIASRMWRERGRSFTEVRHYVETSTPEEHRALVLAEAGVEPPDGEYEVAFVAGPPRELTPEEEAGLSGIDSPMVRRIVADRLRGMPPGTTVALREGSPESGRYA